MLRNLVLGHLLLPLRLLVHFVCLMTQSSFIANMSAVEEGNYTFASGLMTRLYCILKQPLAPKFVTPYNLDEKD